MCEVIKDSQSARDVLTDIAALGPFFSVRAHRPGEDLHPPWLTVGELAVLWGNVASAVNSASMHIAATQRSLARPSGWSRPTGRVSSRAAARAI